MAENNQLVLVTGGGGFIGSKLVLRLLSEGYRVRVLGRSMRGGASIKSDKLEYVCGDISDKDSVFSATKDIDIIYHLAAAMKGDWEEHESVTIGGLKNVVSACIEHKVARLMYMSTLNVYDTSNSAHLHISEDSPYEKKGEQRGYYSHAKLEAEKWLICHRPRETAVCVFRPGLVYGNPEHPFPVDVGKPILNRFFIVPGFGRKKLPFVYVENLVDAILCVTKNTTSKGVEFFNVVDKDVITPRRYLEAYSRLTGNRFVRIYFPFFLMIFFGHLLDFFGRIQKKKNFFAYRLQLLSNECFYTTGRLENIGWVPRYQFDNAMEDFLCKKCYEDAL